MPANRALTDEQQRQFDSRGVLRVASLFPHEAVSKARDAVLSRFASIGLWANGDWQLGGRPKPKWPDKGFSAKSIGNKHDAVEALLKEPALQPVVDTLLSGKPFDRTVFKRPQVLATLPNEDKWFAPHDGWHVDSPRLASGLRPGVQLFAFLDEVKPRGGGTLVVAGSHRLLNDGKYIRNNEITRLLKQEPYFRELMSNDRYSTGNPADGSAAPDIVDGVELEIVELTGAPGDAYFMDMRAIHSGAPNSTERPRMMVTHRFVPADLVGAFTSVPS